MINKDFAIIFILMAILVSICAWLETPEPLPSPINSKLLLRDELLRMSEP